MPVAVTKVITLLQDPEVEIIDLIKGIELDPGLTSNVLRLANSAYFGGPRTIGSLRDAIVRLGTNRVFQLVIASAISPLALPALKGYDLAPGALVQHCVGVAIGTDELTTALKLKASSHAFTAGLLHDLGKVVLGTFVEIDAAPIAALALEQELSFEEAEQEVLGIDHAEVGEILLEGWSIPQAIVDPVRWHHAPDAYRGNERLTVDIVHVANQLALESGLGIGAPGPNCHFSKAATERLGLRVTVAESVIGNMTDALNQVRDAFLAGIRR